MEKKTLHKNGNSAVTNVTMERKYKKKEKEKKLLQHRVPLFVFGHPTEQA